MKYCCRLPNVVIVHFFYIEPKYGSFKVCMNQKKMKKKKVMPYSLTMMKTHDLRYFEFLK